MEADVGTARTGRDPGVAYRELTDRFGTPSYRRVDAPATKAQKARKKCNPKRQNCKRKQ